MGGDTCHCGKAKLANGNCSECREHGQPLQCVGPWAKEKHDYLESYINATWSTRTKYLTPSAEFPKPGGAAYIDLFAGPGRAKIESTGEVIDGSPLLAAQHEKAPFSKLIFCDLDPDNVRALEARLSGHRDRVTIVEGDCVASIDRITSDIPPYGLNLALVDPFGPSGLRWSLLEKLANFQRMDLLIHFPTGSIKRNRHNPLDYDQIVGRFDSHGDVHRASDIRELMNSLRENLAQLGYTGKQVRQVDIRNSKNVILYHLFFAAKKELADNIWSSIAKTNAHGQRSLF